MRRLEGQRIIITRALSQASLLASLLSEEGATPIGLPCIEVQPIKDWNVLDHALTGLLSYDHLVLTSPNAASFFQERFREKWRSSWPQNVTVAVVGEGTESTLQDIPVTWRPFYSGGSETLIKLIQKDWKPGESALWPRARKVRPVLSKGLLDMGIVLDEIVVYDTTFSSTGRKDLALLMGDEKPDWITFASGSAVDGFFSFGKERDIRDWINNNAVQIAALGPITDLALKQHGLDNVVCAKECTIESLVDAMVCDGRKGQHVR